MLLAGTHREATVENMQTPHITVDPDCGLVSWVWDFGKSKHVEMITLNYAQPCPVFKQMFFFQSAMLCEQLGK